MSSWIALRRRVRFEAGQDVLVLGATGNAGRMAIQVASDLGARRVIGAGRDLERLASLDALGATDTVRLEDDPAVVASSVGEVAADADVVLDYLWGDVSAAALTGIVSQRADRGRLLTWIEVGAVAGPTAVIPAAALRACNLHVIGSGQGSVGLEELVAELPALAKAITNGTFQLDARAVPLRDVERAWAQTSSRDRVVLTP